MSNENDSPGESILSLAEKRKQKLMNAALDRLIDDGGALIDPVTGCWLWKGTFGADGYGRYAGTKLVHRHVFSLMMFDLGDDLQADHLCRRRHCFRPAHLDPVTPAENSRRKGLQDRVPPRCTRGHFMAPIENHGRTPEGGVYCKQCLKPARDELVVLDWAHELMT